MKAVKFLSVISIVILLSACGRKEAGEWEIHEDVGEPWTISNTIQLPIMNPKYILCSDDALLYLSNNTSEYVLHTLSLQSYSQETGVSLQYPEADGVSDFYLLGIYSQNFGTSDFLGLWEKRSESDEQNGYILAQYDLQGNITHILQLNQTKLKEYASNIKKIMKEDDVYYLLTNDRLIVITEDGTFKEIKQVAEKSELLTLQDNLFLLENYNNKTIIHQLSKGVLLKDVYEIPISANLFLTGEDGKIYLSQGDQLYRCDVEDSSAELVLQWSNAGVKYLSLQSVIKAKKDKIVILGYVNDGYEIQIIKPTEMADKRTVITLISNQYDAWLQDRAYEFNQENETYKIIIQDPGISTHDEEDLQNRIQLLLTSANPPDMVDLGLIENWRDYAEKNLFEDLTPYLETSEVVNQADYLPNILAGGKVEEKQIFIPYAFTFSMLYGQEKYLGDDLGWTLEELVQISRKQEDLSTFNLDSSSCLHHLMSIGMEEFIDFSELKCDFENQLFYDVLQCAAESGLEKGSYDNFYDDIVEERALMSVAPIVNVEFYLGYTGTVPGLIPDSEIKLTVKGYPSKDGQVKGYASMKSSTCFAISSGSNHKEGAWKFIEYLQTYKDNFYMQFPARKDWLIERMQSISQNSFANIELREYTQNDIDNLLYIIDRLKIQTKQDEIILKIIDEEAQAYFNGQKSEEEVSKIIQSRVQLYLSEQQ